MKRRNQDIFESELYLNYNERVEQIHDMQPSEERTALLKTFIKDIERDILNISGDVLDSTIRGKRYYSQYEFEMMDTLLSMRFWALNNLFHEHCSDEEVRRFTAVNKQLYDMTERMYERTRMVNKLIRNMPLHEKDDDIEVEAKLRFWEDGEPSVIKIEDDAYYGSDFTRMIILLSIIDSDYKCYDEIEQIYVSTQIVDGKVISEDNIDNCLDDGTTWAEAWLRHPKLDHLVICHAVHDICTHKHYSIPDLLRMNMFEMSVDIKIQQFQEMMERGDSVDNRL